MSSFFAVVKLTCRSAWRSHIFQLLLVVLVLCIFILPNTLISDGTLKGEIQLLLQYSFGFIFGILAISSVWLVCSEVCSDVENGKLHMLTVKPISRAKILLAKFTGVVLIHLILLFISSVVIYIFVMAKMSDRNWFFGESKLKTEEQLAEHQAVRSQIFIAKRKYAPEMPDFNELAQQEFQVRMEEAKKNNQDISQYTIGTSATNILEDIRNELLLQAALVKTGDLLVWKYSGLADNITAPLYLRYHIYPMNGVSNEQDRTYGAWMFRIYYLRNDEDANAANPDETVVSEIQSLNPEIMLTSLETEMLIPIRPEYLIYKGNVEVGFTNLDVDEKPLTFEYSKGPFLLVPVTGFFNNYLRTVLVMAFGICSLTLVAAACSACFSLPIAIFFSVAYIFAGIIADYLISSFTDLPGYQPSGIEVYGQVAGGILTKLIVPLQDFFVTGFLASGELIEWATVISVFLFDVLFRSLPLYLLGTWLYSRRELALEMKRG